MKENRRVLLGIRGVVLVLVLVLILGTQAQPTMAQPGPTPRQTPTSLAICFESFESCVQVSFPNPAGARTLVAPIGTCALFPGTTTYIFIFLTTGRGSLPILSCHTPLPGFLE